MRHALLIFALLPWVYLGGEQAYWLAWHRITYGYWLTHYRPMTQDDITCIPPGTIAIKDGEYSSMPIERALLEWCHFEIDYTFSASPP